ncbi:hypothetical protein GSI_08513 [Ganoderma sinense ZZ0214-1]|uniref:Uncharacterized protein n=1 Tax=Ganoderma sinense ZZ0214-1 TaxID=1077348 RepID=A0A2G8S407_9APHY|nr:hypothetical protein GSI_08513 [Ganoderma sinense ZZ0214-1]
MLEAMDVLALPGAGATEIESDRLHRLHAHIPTLSTAISSIIAHLLRWQDEFGVCQDVFSILELPMETLETMLVSLSTSIPEAHILRGRIITQRLTALWNERRVIVEQATRLSGSEDEAGRLEERLDDQREIQDSILESFSALLEQLDDVTSAPVRFLGQEFLVSRFLGASLAFSHLRSQQLDISQDISRLERILDRFMDVVEA